MAGLCLWSFPIARESSRTILAFGSHFFGETTEFGSGEGAEPGIG